MNLESARILVGNLIQADLSDSGWNGGNLVGMGLESE